MATIILVSAMFGLLAWGGIMLTQDEGRIAVVWLANAVLVAVILRSAKRHVPYYLAGAFLANIAANLLAGDTVLNATALAAINQFEIILIWFLMQKLGATRPNMQRIWDLGKFCLIGGLVAPLASGFLAGLMFASGTWQSFLMSWLQWTTTDGLGMILLSPAIMVAIDAFQRADRSNGSRSIWVFSANRWEWLAIQSFTLIAAATIFWVLSFPVFFLVAPLVLLNAFRLGTPGTSVSIVLIAIVVVIGAAFETGPFYSVDLSLTAKLFILQFFLLSCFAVGMPTAAMLTEKASIRRSLSIHREVSNSMLENMNEVLFRTNSDLQWLFLNPAWQKLTGLPTEECLGRDMGEIFAAEDFEALKTQLGPVRCGAIQRARFEGSIANASGDVLAVELSFSRLAEKDGSFLGIVGSIRDITARKQMEQKLIAARVGAEEAADAKTRFLANMSHEIRTPMNGVLGFTQLLLDADLPEEEKNHAQMILDSGNAMMRLLNDILDISKVEAGREKSNIAPMSTQHVLQSCVHLMAPIADQKKLDLKLEIDDNVPEMVLADANHLRQIILNILGNAVKFTSSGSVSVSATAKQAAADKMEMQVMVRDTGIGIPSNRLEAIFSPFEQASPQTSTIFGGSGLGLTISRQLASIMGGTITVDSNEGAGTTFTVQFPAGTEAASSVGTGKSEGKQPMTATNDPAEPPVGRVDNGKILIAEDHDINQILIAEMIKKLGYQPVLAVNGEDAIAKVEAAAEENRPFNLVLMDVQMPVMDGYEATESIRQKGYPKEELPILAITANAYPEDIARCMQAGMQGHIAKPVMFDTLKSSLRDWTMTG
ncbi:ATP-binding protein [Sphingorhabdus sp. YGSMI21]|uniref:ATP-binding protein n=1 Tax=Sphingorhabdus sp. YGSMI21 TaxID=2077182 RepID=UPI0013D96274|nr:ATP-binding protein [Sphingorhabdus sp. YGSMI21]